MAVPRWEERLMPWKPWSVVLPLALLGPMTASAQAPDAASLAGNYCLVGVMEVGSCLRLNPNGRFEYFLAYGAYDENAEGAWKVERGEVVLDSPAYNKRATFSFKRMQRGDTDAYDVIVEGRNGRPLQGISVRPTCDGRTFDAGVTQAQGYSVECRNAPTAVALGLEMFGLGYQTINVASRAGVDKVYVFEFDPGDLGRKRFSGVRLRPNGRDLVMTYTDTPIRELSGRPFRYQRQ
jgi:hypothetical protein